ncbi:MAG: hypothetical protein ACD_12C00348G0001, partial [uncultured bacterium]
MKNRHYQWFTVIIVSIIVSTINIFHVIFGLAKTPIGFTYLATGHYYLDYFEYLQHIAAGIAGRWMPINYFTTEISPVDWRFFPYILMGKIGWIFHLSPVMTYWLTVFILTFLTLIGFYYLINLMLSKETFSLKITAFLIAIFSSPAYQIFINNGQLILNPYDFWYGPASFIRRFEVVPYHALGLILLLAIIVFINKIWKTIPILSEKVVLIKGFWMAVLFIILMTFMPILLVSFIPALLIISSLYFIKSKKNRLKIFLFTIVILTLIIPVGLILRRSTGYGGFNFELKWISHDPWWFVLLNLGPIVLFFPFGLKEYLKDNNFIKQIILTFTLVSYGLFISPAAYLLKTHNLRFFSSLSFVFYGVLTVYGIKKISLLLKNKSKTIMFLISSILIFYSCSLTFYSLNKRLVGLDPSTPETVWTYLPSPIIEGLQLLHNYPQANVLTGPYGEIGMFVPIFSYRRAYVGHPTGTPNIEKKRAIVNFFYGGKMTD